MIFSSKRLFGLIFFISFPTLLLIVNAQNPLTVGNKQSQASVKSIKLSGYVIDEKGEPLIGATVMVIDTKNGAITDVNGKFGIETPENGII